MVVEVNVEPLAPRTTSLSHGNGHELAPDPLVTGTCPHHRVLDPRMHETVPRDVDETDQLGIVPRHHPAEAVPVHLLQPVPFGLIEDSGLEGVGVKLVQLGVLEVPTPCVGDRDDPSARRDARLGQTGSPAPPVPGRERSREG